VWFTHGAELSRYVASEAASAGTDGRPLPGGPPAFAPRLTKPAAAKGNRRARRGWL